MFYRKRASENGLRVGRMLWRAFDKTVRRKPLSFAVDAMGFQSTLVWKLLERRLLAGHPSNRSSSNSNHEGKAHDRLIVTRDRPFFKTPNLGISDVACFGHAIASAAKRLRSHGQTGSNPNKKRSHPKRRIVDVISQAITAPICGTGCRAICEIACTYLT